MAKEKQRHWFLTLWLVLMILANAATSFSNLTGGSGIREAFPNAPGWAIPAMGFLGLINLAALIALFMWKQWGFWACCVTGIAAFALNLLVGVGIVIALTGLLGVVVLFVALQVGGDSKGWPQLE